MFLFVINWSWDPNSWIHAVQRKVIQTKSGGVPSLAGRETWLANGNCGCGADVVCVSACSDTRRKSSHGWTQRVFPVRTLNRWSLFLVCFSSNFQIYAEGLIHLDSARTLQGSPLSFTCGGTDDIVSTTETDKTLKQGHLLTQLFLLNREKSLLMMESVGSFSDTSSLTVGLHTGSTACWLRPASEDAVINRRPLTFR